MSERKLKENTIINLTVNLGNKNANFLFTWKFNEEKALDKVLKDFLRLKNFPINIPYKIYLISILNKTEELDKYTIISKIEINPGDELLISDKIYSNIAEASDDIIYNVKSFKEHKKRNIKNVHKSKFKIFLKPLIISITCLILIGGIGILLKFYILKKNKKDNNNYITRRENNLVIKINYIIDVLYLYESNKIYKMKNEQKIKEKNSESEQQLMADIYFLIKNKKIVFNDTSNDTKIIYTGFLGISNMNIKNETDNIQIIYDKEINKIFNIKSNKKIKEPNLTYIGEKGNLCFAKFNFFENGDIINISYPYKNISISYMQYIEDYSKLIIPKISADLYSENINQNLNELLLNYIKNENKLRRLNQNKNNKNEMIKKKIRKISSLNSSDDFYYEIEEYTSTSNKEPFNYELREKSKCLNCTENILYEASISNIQNEDVNLENGLINKTLNRTFNNFGILESIIQLENIILKSKNDTNKNKNKESFDNDLESDLYLDNNTDDYSFSDNYNDDEDNTDFLEYDDFFEEEKKII